jgi:O-antigen/teichoic acid export membrane protein
LSLFKPAAAVGLYGVPTKMFELATSLPYMFAGLMMPLLAKAAPQPGKEFSRLLGRSLDAMLIYGVGAMLALGACAPQLLSFISGPEFAEGAPALVILAVAGIFASLSITLRFSLIALDRPRFVLLADAASCAIALVAYFVLIPTYSLYGAAIGTAIAEFSVYIAMLVGVKKAGQPLPPMLASVKTIIAGVTAGGAIWLALRIEWNWMLALAVGGAVYVVLLALTGALPREFLENLKKKKRAPPAEAV